MAGMRSQGAFWTCSPSWDDVYPYYCKIEGGSGCGSGGCPGCLRYPAAAKVNRRPLLLTQILVFGVESGSTLGNSVEMSVAESGGLSPTATVAELLRGEFHPDVLLGYSVESSVGMTVSRHRTADGSGMIVQSSAAYNGFIVRLYGFHGSEELSCLGSKWVPGGEAAAFLVDTFSRRCLVVVHTVSFSEQSRDATMSAYHGPFLEAAARFPFSQLMGIQVDNPRDSSPAMGTFFRVQALTDNMLESAGSGVHRY